MNIEANNIGASVGAPLCIDVQGNGTLSNFQSREGLDCPILAPVSATP